MPWRWATLRGQRVLARVSPSGELLSNGGRVEIRYKAGDPRAYHAAAHNLELAGGEILPEETCPPPNDPAPSKTAASTSK